MEPRRKTWSLGTRMGRGLAPMFLMLRTSWNPGASPPQPGSSFPASLYSPTPSPPSAGAPGRRRALASPRWPLLLLASPAFLQHLSPSLPLSPPSLLRRLPFLKPTWPTRLTRAAGPKGSLGGGRGWGSWHHTPPPPGFELQTASGCPDRLAPKAQPLPSLAQHAGVWQSLPHS